MKNQNNIAKLREQLPHGAQTEIAKRANVSVNTVHRIVNGQNSKNLIVLNAIVDYIHEQKDFERSVNERISELID